MKRQRLSALVIALVLGFGPVTFAQTREYTVPCEDWLQQDMQANNQELASCLQRAPWYGEYGCAVVYQSMRAMAYSVFAACVATR
jgi:hypothetical protein